jgi:hypothetical protein
MIDENAVVKAAIELDIPDYRAREVIAAYITASAPPPPAPAEVAGLIERLSVGAGYADCVAAADALTSQVARLAEVEKAAGVACSGCGCTKTIEQVRFEYPEALSCCPERDMVPAATWMKRAEAAEARLAEVERDKRNLQAALARAKTMLKARDALINARDELQDEGDRVYFGSTNDADEFREVVDEMDAWAWNDIMRDGALPDVYETSRKAHADLASATAHAKRLEAAGSKLSFAAQTTGGTAGRDESLCEAIENWQTALFPAPSKGGDDE